MTKTALNCVARIETALMRRREGGLCSRDAEERFSPF